MPRHRLLVVEDEIELLLILVNVALERGYDASGTSDPREVMPRIRAIPPAVVLLDLHMPHLDGRRLLADLVAEPNAPAVIVMSGLVDGRTYDLCRACGADIVHKPFELDDLFRRIEAASRLVGVR